MKNILWILVFTLLTACSGSQSEPRVADRYVGVQCISVTKSFTDAFGREGVVQLRQALSAWEAVGAPRFVLGVDCATNINVGHIKNPNSLGVRRTLLKLRHLILLAEIVIDEDRVDLIALKNCKRGQYELYQLLLHELGHLYGLRHRLVPASSVMYPYSHGCNKAEITQQDIDDLTHTYRRPVMWDIL